MSEGQAGAASGGAAPTAAAAPPPTGQTSVSAVAATGTSGSSNAVAPASTNVKTEGISSTSTTSNLVQEPADAAVVAYLQKRGLGSAALELTQLLEQDSSKRAKTTVDLSTTAIQADEAHARHQRTALSLATGGGLGYDVDAAPAVTMWGGAVSSDTATITNTKASPALNNKAQWGQDEARAYVQSFTALQTWVLALPDDPPTLHTRIPNIQEQSTADKDSESAGPKASITPNKSATDVTGAASGVEERKKGDVAALVGSTTLITTSTGSNQHEENMYQDHSVMQVLQRASQEAGTDPSHYAHVKIPKNLNSGVPLPPSAKPELMAVTFTLLVHTYCELLESGLEGTACALLATYRPMHEPLYRSELEDLQKCRTTADIVALNANVTANTESLLQIKNVRTQIAVARKKRVDLSSSSSSGLSSDQMRAVKEVDDQLASLDGAYRQGLLKVTACANQLKNLPFLRRARALRWQIGLSATSYSLLASFLNQPNLQPVSSLLQARCHINVEKRDPLPYTPHSILEDMVLPSSSGQETDEQNDKDNGVKWAAPMHPVARLVQEGEDVTKVSEAQAILSGREALPFPQVYLDTEGYNTSEKALKAKQSVEFNRALLMNGFRRLEALELKAEYEVGMRQAKSKENKPGDAEDETHEPPPQDQMADPLAPSVLMSTLCSSSFSGSVNSHKALVATKGVGRYGGAGAVGSHLEAPGIGITCARMCPPDGRRVATGCDDAAIRIWSLHNNSNKSEGVNTGSSKGGKGTIDSSSSATASTANMDEASMILLGHKNGFPVFDLDWNRDGRTLISAGGDGTVRLWDSLAVGPYGRLAKVVKRSSGTSSSHVTSINKAGLNPSGGPNTSVSGMKTEPMVEINGAALAVYRGHSPQTPLWSVSFAPSGYYFLTGGSDSTARLWTTDRTTPVRIFSGHQSPNVNTVTWHPNCNYVVTGSDDKTARLWDIQSGRCVRLLSGCAAGINVVTVCPSGRYVAGADYSGTVNIWELGTGRKVNELRPPVTSNKAANIIHSVAYSSCGTALATGGEDCLVNIWDVRGVANHMSDPDYATAKGWGTYAPPMTMVTSSSNQPNNGDQNRFGMREPVRSFRTKHTSILDLFYTKRNLLLSVGNYTVVPAGGVSENNPAQ